MPSKLQFRDAYLQRLGHAQPPPPTLDTLRELQQRHTAEFPFETLSTLLGEPVPLDLPALERKLLHDRRGGYCYELNGLFMALLRELGYEVRALAGRVVMDGGADAARTHLLLLVTVDGVRHLADVGFGGLVPTAPLLLDDRGEQATPHESYRLDHDDGEYALHARVMGEWRPLYRFDLQPQSAVDCEVGNWYVSTHPASPFLGHLRAARTGPGIRKVLLNGRYSLHRIGERSERRELPDADAVLEVLGREFDLHPPQDPGLREAIARRIEQDRLAEGAAQRPHAATVRA
ncbi:arylamine N-acetyltransferase [Luteimonas sp. RD2P54]|uniref:Arylamine N-acetyltransferase n=1 Tax=Luteimonas endophytica TaxID=3042023 RepID=A0ABT6JA30_9GAMM|nr:arylamine N-acetyltransferase [Luteimonas endophytica]MDH5823680.1 arylamine N-acetyltransferase [Luteimonas endophytica]